MATKVNPLKSLGAKLFYLTTTLVVMAVGSLAWKNTTDFRKELQQKTSDSFLSDAERIGRTLGGVLDGLDYRFKTLLLQAAAIPTDAQRSKMLEDFVATNHEFLGVGLYKIEEKSLKSIGVAYTKNYSDKVFAQKIPAKFFAAVDKLVPNKLKSIGKNKGSEVQLFSLYRETGVPSFVFVRHLQDKANNLDYWGVFLAYSEPLSGILSTSDLNTSLVLDSSNLIFASKDLSQMASKRSYKDIEVVRKSRSNSSPSISLKSYKDEWGIEWTGAASVIDKYGLTVLVQAETKKILEGVEKSIFQTFLFGSLFILIAVLFSYLGSNSVTKGLRMATEATQKIAAGDFNANLRSGSTDEVGILSQSVNAMARQIKNLMLSQAQKVRFEKELETAQAVQNTLFPKGEIRQGPINISGYSTPASECGGDWWGHFTGEEGLEYVFIADAMGHGVPAALVTAMAYSSCRTIITSQSLSLEDRRSPKKILEHFNNVLFEAVQGSISMTLFAMVIDYKNNKLIYSNAGHNFPILLPADPNDERIHKKIKALQKISPLTPVSLQLAGDSLGLMRDASFGEAVLPLKAGDKFILFTDGLIECTSPQGKSWGRKTLLEKILLNTGKDAMQFKNDLVKDAKNFLNGQPLADDITLVVVEYCKSVEAELSAPLSLDSETSDESGPPEELPISA